MAIGTFKDLIAGSAVCLKLSKLGHVTTSQGSEFHTLSVRGKNE